MHLCDQRKAGFPAGKGRPVFCSARHLSLIHIYIEETIKSMGYIGRVGMRATDTEILNVMIDRADVYKRQG